MDKKKVFHGCFTKNKDGTNQIIDQGEQCLTPTSRPFWKYPEDISGSVRNRSQEKKQKKITKREFDKYLKKRYSKMARGGPFKSSYFSRIRYILCCAVIGFLIVFIVNNENILTDGCRYRKRPKMEM